MKTRAAFIIRRATKSDSEGILVCHREAFEPHRASDAPDAFLDRGMAVRPSWQGGGVAQELLASVESTLRLRGCSRISLDTAEPLARALRFYERNGFRPSGKVTDFFGMSLFEYVKILG